MGYEHILYDDGVRVQRRSAWASSTRCSRRGDSGTA